AIMAAGFVGTGIAWVSATQKRDELAAKLEKSEKSEREASEQLALARKAVTEVYDLAKDRLFQQDQYKEGRKQLLERLQPYHGKLRDLQPTDKTAKAEQAESLFQLAGIDEELGKPDEAEKLLNRSRDTYAALARDHADEAEHKAGSARASNALGELQLRQ